MESQVDLAAFPEDEGLAKFDIKITKKVARLLGGPIDDGDDDAVFCDDILPHRYC
jgi:hypothetical protein